MSGPPMSGSLAIGNDQRNEMMRNINSSLSVVDISRVAESVEHRKQAARTLDEVNRSMGFFSIVGHGVSVDLIDRMRDVTARFFQLPEDQKAAGRADRRAGARGWEPVGYAALSRSLGKETRPHL